jgi:hypothetical protein
MFHPSTKRLAMRRATTLPFLLMLVVGAALRAAAQDSNIVLPIALIERNLTAEHFELRDRRDTRFEGDRTQRVVLIYPDSNAMMVKWARAPRHGTAFNNEPRYEVAAYLIQKMFLDENSYVVPPTAIRAVPLHWYRDYDEAVTPTFDRTSSVMVALQFWLGNVSGRGVYDPRRMDTDTAYARHFANLNVLTYLIHHQDSNDGNVLISTDSANPRLFAVDNGVAFRAPPSDRGTAWRDLRVRRLPRGTVERLRGITREDLERTLGVVAQFQVQDDGQLVPVEPTASVSGHVGVRRRGDIIQFGLTPLEIRGVHGRLQRLLRQVDSGRITTF